MTMFILKYSTLLIFFLVSLLSFSPCAVAEAEAKDIDGAHPIHLTQATDPGSSSFIGNCPIAAAGPDQLVDEKNKVYLDASNSWPLDISRAMIFWKQLEGPQVQLSNPEDVRPFFIAPEVGPEGAALVFELTLASDEGTAVDTCIVNVSWGNIQPSADAGADQKAARDEQVFLDGSGSLDPDGQKPELRYQWRQTGGPQVVLSNPTACKTSFTAPYTRRTADSLRFELTVTDKGGLKSSDSTIVNISPQNIVLVSDAGPEGVYDEGSRVVLDASNALSQPEKIIHYFWTQQQGPPVTLSDPTSIKPTFLTPPVKNFETANLVFELTVTSESGLMASGKTRIRVDDNWFTSYSQDVVVLPIKTRGIGFEVVNGGRIVDLSPVSLPAALANQSEEIPYGLFNLQVRTYMPGGKAELKVYLPDSAPAGYQWFKCNKETDNPPIPVTANFNADRTVFTISLEDGGPGDEDGSPNGWIIDPAGLGGPLVFASTDGQTSQAGRQLAPKIESSKTGASGSVGKIGMAKLIKLIFNGFGELPEQAGATSQEPQALAASHVGWNWLTMQFGPAFHLMLFGGVAFASIVLLKKAIRALISHKDEL